MVELRVVFKVFKAVESPKDGRTKGPRDQGTKGTKGEFGEEGGIKGPKDGTSAGKVICCLIP